MSELGMYEALAGAVPIEPPCEVQPNGVAVPMGTAVAGSQIDIADQFAEAMRNRLRYIWTEREWLLWNGTVWRPDDTGSVREMIKLFLGKLSLSTAGSENMARTLASERSIGALSGSANRIACSRRPRISGTPTRRCCVRRVGLLT
jgi:hypothetical protein